MATPGVEIIESTGYFGYIYMWCDTQRNQYYIGSHKGSVFDKYKSGSKWLNDTIKKRPDTMKMRVLEYYFGDGREELYRIEDKWLKFYDVENNDNYYNFKNQARGGMGPFKHKGKKRVEYTPGWIDHRIGKKLEDIYKNPEEVRMRLAKTQKDYFEKHGCGYRKGKKNSGVDPRKGKTVVEIYGYNKTSPVPPKPFIITINKPFEDPYDIYCRHETDFYKLINMESNNLGYLKKDGEKEVLRRLPSTRHDFPIGTILTLKFVDTKTLNS
jgi:hypothetical protein